jgi:glutamate/tyrosine decarboxylase-like PLP-dependent enzyme
MGGVTLTYLERLGHDIPPWNFTVPGVTSISVDLHKYGYTAKGASVIMHRNKRLRNYQTFVTDNWLGGVYGSSGVLGTKGGGAMAAAWAVMHYLGDDGYLRVTAAARARVRATDGRHRATPDHWCCGQSPTATLVAFSAADPERTRRLRRGRRAVAPRLVRRSPGPAGLAALHRQRGARGQVSPQFVGDLHASPSLRSPPLEPPGPTSGPTAPSTERRTPTSQRERSRPTLPPASGRVDQ